MFAGNNVTLSNCLRNGIKIKNCINYYVRLLHEHNKLPLEMECVWDNGGNDFQFRTRYNSIRIASKSLSNWSFSDAN